MPTPTKTKIGLQSATSLVISAMVGTGVYTSLGFQVVGIESVWAILVLWLVGGLVALCGSLAYGEIGSVLHGSGGEYNYLSKLYHPAVGFMSGFVSSTIGFAAPVALSSMAFGKYVNTFLPDLSDKWLATTLLVVITALQCSGVKHSSLFQRLSTVINLSLIVLFISCGFYFGPHAEFSKHISIGDIKQVFTPAFAISLVYVSYSYSGWNNAAYVAGEIENPKRNLPMSLVAGTGIVALLYMSLNFVFLYNVPTEELKGKLEVGFVAAEAMMGSQGAKVIACMIALALTASVSAMTFVGPRVTTTILGDFLAHRHFADKTWPALLVQCAIALLLIHTSTFQHVLTYIGFTLSLFTCLVVGGVFILRKKYPNETGFKTWGYPFTPILFLVIDVLMLAYIFWDQPYQSLAGLATAGLGAFVYFVSSRFKVRSS